MRGCKLDRGRGLDVAVCALLVIEAELACLPLGSEHRARLRARRDHAVACLADWQIEQLRRIGRAVDDLLAREGRSEAA
jgi:hypothetical protein